MHLSLQANNQLLNNGQLGDERILYYRELIARFSHHVSHRPVDLQDGASEDSFTLYSLTVNISSSAGVGFGLDQLALNWNRMLAETC